jgi:PhnB protein
VKDVDDAFSRAGAAGAEVKMPLDNIFWGDRYGVLTDPFGHSWSLATHKEDVTPEEIAKRVRDAGTHPETVARRNSLGRGAAVAGFILSAH